MSNCNEILNTVFIARHFGMAYSTAKRIIKILEQRNCIKRIGNKKTGYWLAID